MNLNIFKVGVVALLLWVPASFVFAADEKKSEATEVEVMMQEVSIIGSKFGVRDIAASAHYLDTQDIRQHNVDDINRVLRRVPGVNLRGEDGFGLFPNISIRGVNPSRAATITVMEDGILQAPAPYAAPDAYYIPTTGRMAAIEILKGSSQIKYGPRTTGGAINYISTRIPTTDKMYLKSGFGSFNEIRTHANFGGTRQTASGGKFGYLIEIYSRQNAGFKKYIKEQIDSVPGVRNSAELDTGFARHEPMLKLSYEPKTNKYQKWEAKFGHTNLDANVTYLGLPEGLSRSHTYGRMIGSRFDEIESTQFRSYIKHLIQLTPKTRLTTTAYGNTFNRNWQKLNKADGTTLSQALAGGNGYEVLIGREAGTLEVKNNNRAYYSWGVQFDLNHQLQMGEVEHNFDVGVRFHKDQIRRKQWSETFTMDIRGNVDSVATGARGSKDNRQQQVFAIATHVADTMKWGKFSFSPGVRVETMTPKYCDKGGCGQTNNASYKDGSRTYSVIVGGGSLKYDWIDSDGRDIDIFGGVHRGFNPAGPKDNVQSGLTEETSIGMELGIRYANDRRAFSTELIGFNTILDDMIVADSIGGTGAGSSENIGKVHNYGIEYSLNYDRGVDKGLSYQMPMYLAATIQAATFLETGGSTIDVESVFSGSNIGNSLPYVPDLNLAFGIGAIFEKWSYNLDGNFVTKAYADGANQNNQVNPVTGTKDVRFGSIPSRFVVDGAVGYQWSKQARLFGNVKNITANEYIISRQPHGPRPGLPFSLMAGIELTL